MNIEVKVWVLWRPAKGTKRGRWIARFSLEGQRKDETVPHEVAGREHDERAARKWAEARAEELVRKNEPVEETIGALYPKFLDLVRSTGKAAATLVEYEGHGRLSLLPEFGQDRCDALEVPRLRGWIRKMAGEGRSRPTCNNRLSTLAVFLDFARGEGWTKAPNWTRDPAVRAVLPKASEEEIFVPTPEVVGQLVACEAVPFIRRLRYLVAAHGIDDGCISALRWRNFMLQGDAGMLDVKTALALRGPNGWATEQGPKTTHRKRKVPISKELVVALVWWRDVGSRVWVGATPSADDWIFVNSRGEPWRPQSAKFIRDDLRTAGVDADFDFKALRKYFATRLSEAGATSEQRARLLGHRGPTTAARFYTAAEILLDRELVARLPQLLCPPDPEVHRGCTGAPDWSHLRDLNSRPTVYEGDLTGNSLDWRPLDSATPASS